MQEPESNATVICGPIAERGTLWETNTRTLDSSRRGIIQAGVFGLLTTAVIALLPRYVEAAQPNVIIILSDDARYADSGVTGGTLVPTPQSKLNVLC